MQPPCPEQFKDYQVLLLAHGSKSTPEGAVFVHRQAEALRQRNIFGDVQAAFLQDTPHPRDILETSEFQDIFVVPFMISEGHTIDVIIPDALSLNDTRTTIETAQGVKHIALCRAIGTHRDIRRQSCHIIEELKSTHGLNTGETSALVLCHGTKRHKGSRKYAEQVLRDIQNSGLVEQSAMLFLEETPRIDEWRSCVSTRYVIVLPYLMTAGRHGAFDIPDYLGIDTTSRAFHENVLNGTTAGPYDISGRKLWYTPLVGAFDVIPDIVVSRVMEKQKAT